MEESASDTSSPEPLEKPQNVDNVDGIDNGSSNFHEDEEGPSDLDLQVDHHHCAICSLVVNNEDRKEYISAGGYKKGDQIDDNWIQCDVCNKWYHIGCTDIEEFETKLLEKYHCEKCAIESGPSIPKEPVAPHRRDFSNEKEIHKPVEVGTKPWIESFIKTEANIPECSDLRIFEDGNVFMNNFAFDSEWQTPVKILVAEGLGMKLPHDSFDMNALMEMLDLTDQIYTIDVYMQQSSRMSLKKFYEKWNEFPRKRLYNMLSFEFSHTNLMNMIKAPELMYQLSWVHRFWPADVNKPVIDYLDESHHWNEKPNVSMFCLLGMAGSYTDFHIDFGGSSVWYHVFKGQKIFYVIEPTKENLETFATWSGNNKTEIFLPRLIKSKPAVTRIVINPGETLMIPSGWIHAVYTPEDSMVFGGNFIHELNIARQLQVFDIEQKCNYDDNFMFPSFKLTNWYAAINFLDRAEGLGPDLIEGYRTLLTYLEKWEKEDRNTWYKGVFTKVVVQMKEIFKKLDGEFNEIEYNPESEKMKKVNFHDYSDSDEEDKAPLKKRVKKSPSKPALKQTPKQRIMSNIKKMKKHR